MANADLNERIAKRAYELYEQRGGRPGADLEDWLQAEREIGEVSGGNGAKSKTAPKKKTVKKTAAAKPKKAAAPKKKATKKTS